MLPPNLSQLYNQLQRSFKAKPCDLKTCGSLLAQLKIGLIEAGLLLPVGEKTQKDVQDLVIARDILEMGAFWSIRAKDIPSFDRYFSQLSTFYTDYSTLLPPSPRHHCILGLNLTHLLTQNRIADFHTTLESLPLRAEEISENAYIRHPVNLERWLMEGSYSKVWNARGEAPVEEYGFFGDRLMETIRNEIASCEESAYESLPLKDAATLLFFTTPSELLNFAKQRGWQVDLSANIIRFKGKSDSEQVEMPRQKLIAESLLYARELEQIV
jgi:26S proteasome regulatory subunit N12